MARGNKNAWGRLALLLILGTIPAVVIGVLLDKLGFMDLVRQMPVMAATATFSCPLLGRLALASVVIRGSQLQ